ncbi:unnamed protein product [Durusdinium trenchii]|uniref:Uncharacterized protein n=1 Tax=Durusdinium trenchii TaxID=1381693 RepID=A0ABP0RB64_9DINO
MPLTPTIALIQPLSQRGTENEVKIEQINQAKDRKVWVYTPMLMPIMLCRCPIQERSMVRGSHTYSRSRACRCPHRVPECPQNACPSEKVPKRATKQHPQASDAGFHARCS